MFFCAEICFSVHLYKQSGKYVFFLYFFVPRFNSAQVFFQVDRSEVDDDENQITERVMIYVLVYFFVNLGIFLQFLYIQKEFWTEIEQHMRPGELLFE